jgi:hypothetical protein
MRHNPAGGVLIHQCRPPAFWLFALLVLVGVPDARAAEADSDLEYYEKTLREAKISPDGPSLLEYFRKRTLSEQDRTKLADTVRLLGHADYRMRRKAFADLLAAGRPALVFLNQALNNPDPEIARSAEQLKRRIEVGADALTIAAARVLAVRKPAGSIKVLLAYMPMIDDDQVRETMLDVLPAVGIRDGKIDPVLETALHDSDAGRRLAAAIVYSKGKPEERKVLGGLLRDSDALVRLHAALALAPLGDKAAVDALIALVGEDAETPAWRAEDFLYQIAADKGPSTPGTTDKTSRRKSRQAWESWWQKNASQVDLTKLQLGKALRGLTVIVEHDGAGRDGQGRIWERGLDGKVRWELTSGLGGPLDVHYLPNGRLLIAEYIGRRVTERDRKGNVLWEKKCNNSVLTCQRLRNGNTLIATMSEILEVTREGKTVFSYPKPSVYYAEKLRDGHIIYTTATQVVELDAAGKEIRAINLNGMSWGCVEKLTNGRYLVGLYGANRVVEVDGTGKVFWECNVSSPTRATRLPNGNTLVSSSEGRMVVELNRARKEVLSVKTAGRVWRVRRY